jgi:hypothetical protein
MSNINGIWDCIVHAPVGKEPHELTLQCSPEGALTGDMKNLKNGAVMALSNGKVEGSKLTWTMKLVTPFKVTLNVELEVSGNELKGYGSTTLLGKAAITGTKRT